MKILFVCSGNSCRSAMAEGIAKKWADEHGIRALTFASAGILGIVGAPASENAIIARKEIGLDITSHRSRGTNRGLINSFDYIFGMENAHIQYCRDIAPERQSRIYLLGDFGPGANGEEVPDPLGFELEYFRRVRDKIKEHLSRILPFLENEI